MSYTTLELLRKTIADPFKFAYDKQTGDGSTTKFKLSHGRIKSSDYAISINDVQKAETTDYTIDLDEGYVTFLTAPALNAVIEAEYYFTAFTDEELTEFLALDSNDVDKVTLRCIDILLMDSARRFDYSVGNNDIKASQVFQNLKDLREIIFARIEKSESETTQLEQSGGVTIANRQSTYYPTVSPEDDDLSRSFNE